jgi:hypothetical protein
MLQRGYNILIIGATMLILGTVISAFWAGSFASSFLRHGIILSNVAIPPSGFISSTIQLTDITHPIALQVHFESHSGGSSSIGCQNVQTSNTSNNMGIREVVNIVSITSTA